MRIDHDSESIPAEVIPIGFMHTARHIWRVLAGTMEGFVDGRSSRPADNFLNGGGNSNLPIASRTGAQKAGYGRWLGTTDQYKSKSKEFLCFLGGQ